MEISESQAISGGELGGNTNPTHEKRSRHWAITWFSYPENWKQIFESQTSRYVAQIEKCPTTGRLHVQGSLHFKHQKTWNGMKASFPGSHFSVMKSIEGSDDYCKKLATRHVMNPFRDEHMIMYRWQAEMLDVIQGPTSRRKIYWYWSESGEVGKSIWARHLVLMHGAFPLKGGGRDATFGIAENQDAPIFIFNVPRGGHVDYEIFEEIKDGMLYSQKYECKMVLLNYPHIFVFANFPPDEKKLSKDRWIVQCIDPIPVDPESIINYVPPFSLNPQ